MADKFLGSSNGLTIVTEAGNVRVTSAWNSGFMGPGIKGAFLASTETADLVGVNGPANGDFSNGLVGFIDVNSHWSVVGGKAFHASSSVFNMLLVDVSAYAGKLTRIGFAISDVSGAGRVRLQFRKSDQSPSDGRKPYSNIGTDNDNPSIIDESSYVWEGVVPADAYYLAFARDLLDVTSEFSLDDLEIDTIDPDRSVNANGLIINGTIDRDPVATGADLVGYSGFSASDYLEQPYNADLDFGTGDFCVMGWVNTSTGGIDRILQRDTTATAQRFSLYIDGTGKAAFLCDDDTTTRTATSSVAVNTNSWQHVCGLYDSSGLVSIYVNGVLSGSSTGAPLLTLNNPGAKLVVGNDQSGVNAFSGSLALLRIGATAPSAAQIKAIYDAESPLFKEGAQATLHGSSDAVTALAHDKATDLLHVGTSGGMSTFKGLRRIDQDDDAVTTFIAADGGSILRQ